VACLASSLLRGEQLQTFTGAFREGPEYDETRYARAVAQQIGARYNETYVTGDEFSTLMPRLIYMMDEPVAGPGLIPQYYVSKLAAQPVKVVLGGQGGDEIFAGYARYLIPYLERALQQSIDGSVQSQFTLAEIAPNLDVLGSYKPLLSRIWADDLFGDPAARYFALVDRSDGMRELFDADLWSGKYDPRAAFHAIFNRPEQADLLQRMSYFDLRASLPALLHVEDRTSMAVSVESRVPLLDHRLVELAARIPTRIKFASGRLKHVFREAVRNIVPRSVLERKDKMGFPVPLAEWYRGVAREFVHDTLLSRPARERGIYDANRVRKLLDADQAFGRLTWGLLCIELWHRAFIDGDAAESPRIQPDSAVAPEPARARRPSLALRAR
jgi:asparagine synthase (glutamine-hydrolysing)